MSSIYDYIDNVCQLQRPSISCSALVEQLQLLKQPLESVSSRFLLAAASVADLDAVKVALDEDKEPLPMRDIENIATAHLHSELYMSVFEYAKRRMRLTDLLTLNEPDGVTR